ncbi:hypothetical protein IV102_04950 [bacterium]|nr:hypothetical protein [bacterium]
MQAICDKCKGTGKVLQPLPPDGQSSDSQAPDTPAEPQWVRCPGCLGGGIIDTTAMA